MISLLPNNSGLINAEDIEIVLSIEDFKKKGHEDLLQKFLEENKNYKSFVKKGNGTWYPSTFSVYVIRRKLESE